MLGFKPPGHVDALTLRGRNIHKETAAPNRTRESDDVVVAAGTKKIHTPVQSAVMPVEAAAKTSLVCMRDNLLQRGIADECAFEKAGPSLAGAIQFQQCRCAIGFGVAPRDTDLIGDRIGHPR